MADTLIIGGGLTGLSLGYFLKKNYLIFEKEKKPGGLCRSVHTHGYTFDYSGHFLHLHNQKTNRLINELLKNNIKVIKRDTWIYTHSSWVPFPFQANLSYLPEKIKKECLKDFINRKKQSSKSFYGWSLATFGKGITKYFMKPYNEKLWTVSSKVLGSDWVAEFVPVPKLQDIKRGAEEKLDKSFGYNVYFCYPAKGGMGALIDAFYKKIKNNVKLGELCKKIDLKNRYVETSGGKRYYFKTLVSTQPLAELIKSIKDLPKNITSAADKLACNSVTCVNLGVKLSKKGEILAEGRHWIYFPEKKYPFYRVGFYRNIMPSSTPSGRSAMYIEVSHKPGEKININKLVKDCIKSLKSARILEPKTKIDVLNVLEMPYAYVIYDAQRKAALETIIPFLEKHGIYSIGRYGAWEYSFMEKNILDAMSLAEKLNG